MIKIAPSTLNIEPSFKNALLGMYQAYLNEIDRASGGNQERRISLLKSTPDASRRALDAVNGVKEARRGLSYDYTRFAVAAEYIRLYAVVHNGKTWLAGDTKPVVIEGKDRNTNRVRTWNIGSYCVAFDLDGLAQGQNYHHFIPLEAPMTGLRHPHHYAIASEIAKSPLDLESHTCWGQGGFSTGVSFAIQDRDISSLFSIIFKYLSRYNSSSVYGGWSTHGVENVAWMQKLN